MGRDIVNNLKFKKQSGSFDVDLFASQLNEAYLALKKPDGEMIKKSFSPSTLGYGHGNCPRYWYMAFSGTNFIDDNDAIAVANMQQGTQAHDRLQGLISQFPQFVTMEEELLNEYPPIRGFIDLVMDYGKPVLGEIKTAKQEVWDTRRVTMASSSNHMLQLLTYMHVKNVEEGFFLYENKNTQEVLVIPISMTDKNKKIINELFSWMCDVWDNFQNGDMPTKPEGASKTKMPCTYCPVKKECWSKKADPGSVDIPLYEVPSV